MFRILGIVTGAISFAILLWKGFDFAFGPFLLASLQAYEDQAHALFGLFEPFIKTQLDAVRAYVGWDLQLYPHWKHAFLLMWLFFGASAQATWKVGYRGTAIFAFVWGGAVALVMGIMSGTVPLDSEALVLWPILGFTLFGLGNAAWTAVFERSASSSWLEHFWIRGVTAYAVVGLLAVIGLLDVGARSLFPELHTLPSPGLALLTALIVVLALFLLAAGVLRRLSGSDGNSRVGLRNFDIEIALSMLAVIGGASGVVLLGMWGI